MRSEDGPIGGQYRLTETPSAKYLQRTEWNVRDSDGTVIFTFGVPATGGSLRTIEFARRLGKPFLHIQPANYQPARDLQQFVELHKIRRLNVAGSRESKDAGIHLWVMAVIEDAFFWSENHPHILGGPREG